MADSTHPNTPDENAMAADDPFAELSRIMGFDPRGNARPAKVAEPAVAQPQDEAFSDEDFSLELERELLGEFVAGDEGSPADRRDADPVVGEPLSASDEGDFFSASDVEIGRVSVVEPEHLEPIHAGKADLGFEQTFEPAMVSAEDLPAHADHFAADEHPAADEDFGAPEQPDAVFEAIGRSTAIDEAFDLAMERGHDEMEREIADEPVADEPLAVAHTQAPDDQDTDLDAELDLRLMRDLDAVAHAFDSTPGETSEEQAQAEPREQADPSSENGLEQELNALLGNDRDEAPQSAAELPPEFPAAPVWPGFARPAAVAHPAPVDDEPELEADDVPVFAAPAAQETLGTPPTADFVADEDIDHAFDETAFDDALSNGIAEGKGEPETDAGAHLSATVDANPSELQMQRDGSDPYAALAALSANLRPVRAWNEADDAQPNHAAHEHAAVSQHAARHAEDAPEIETIDLQEQAVALADDLDLPEFAFEDDAVKAEPMDDLETEFSNLLSEMNAAESDASRLTASPRPHTDARYGGTSSSLQPGGTMAAAAAAGIALAGSRAGAEPIQLPRAHEAGRAETDMLPTDREFADTEFAYDPDLDSEMAAPAYAPIIARPRPRRGLLVAALVGGVAILGGVGAFAFSYGEGGGSDQPALVKADPDPVKIKPENPGGTAIPNQDNKVYDSAATGDASGPAQEKLITSAEEPIELPAMEDDSSETAAQNDATMATGGAGTMQSDPDMANATTDEASPSGLLPKAEDRVEQAAADNGIDDTVEVAAVAPRKVRTMVVKADGTIVARDEPEQAAEQPVASASEGIVEPVAQAPSIAEPTEEPTAAAQDDPAPMAAEPAETVPEAPAMAAEAPAAAEPAAPAIAKPKAETPTRAQAQSSTTPNRAPIVPARPSDQPVDIVGEVKAERVAALSPAAAAPAASGSWAMQIASQPNEASAQSTYQDLARRYGNVLGGRQANIVKADVAGKGTFWRVRVPAGTRNDAIKLCENYKAAGGNCFVSR